MPRETLELKRRAREYLSLRQEAVDSLEIAREVLGIKGGPDELARRLVVDLLAEAGEFVLVGDDRWRLRFPADSTGARQMRENGMPGEATPPGMAVGEGGLFESDRFVALEGLTWTDRLGRRHLIELAGEQLGENVSLPPFRYLLSPDVASSHLRTEGDTGIASDEIAAADRLEDVLPVLIPTLQRSIIVAYRPAEMLRPLTEELYLRHGLSLETRELSLRRLARQLLPGGRHVNLEELAACLGLSTSATLRAQGRVSLAVEIAELLGERAWDRGISSVSRLLDLQYPEGSEVDLTGTDIDRNWLDDLPSSPGIYRIYDQEGTLLYVGKAARLFDRVNHYFRRSLRRDEREMKIIERAHRVEIVVCGSELMALILEEREIRENKPLLNVQRRVFPRKRRPRGAGNLALLLPGGQEGEIDLVFYRPPSPLRTLAIPLTGSLSPAVERATRALLREAITPPAPKTSGEPVPSRPVDEPTVVELEIASSWIEVNRNGLLTINLGAVKDEAHAMKLIMAARCDLPSHHVEGVDYR